jgi:hypothetical protein
MRVLIGLAITAATIAAAGAAHAQKFDPRAHRTFAGPPSQVLVLGAPHLSGLPDTFKPEQLAPVLDKLAAWKPAIITIEALSGPQCEYLRRYAVLHANAADDYCPDPSAAQRSVGLDMAGATIAAEQALAKWPATPTPAQRRHLAALFLAGGNPASALVQWLRLPPAERRVGDGVDAAMVALIEKRQVRRDESIQVAAVLAARLGLERVYPTDDHTADDDAGSDPAYGKAVSAAWDNPATAKRKADGDAFDARLAAPGGMLSLYRYYNDVADAELTFDSDFGAALNDSSPGRYGRRHVGWWETRNLRMVANIRAVLQRQPGARLLTIVGASHKGYFEAYLDLMHDVTLADAQAVLR